MVKIGKYEIITIDTGEFCLDGGGMFGIIPKLLWEKTNPPDDRNRVLLNARLILLRSDTKTILVDTGIGENWDNKFNKIYRVDQSENSLLKSLKSNSIEPEEITDVILTHLHFDHTGGAVTFSDGKFIPQFPKAEYFVQKEHFEWAENPSGKDKGSFKKERFLPLAEEGMLKFIEGNIQFDDEIELLTFDGHTPSQQLLKLSDSSRTIFYCGDLIPFTSHLHLPYIMSFDLEPLKTLSEKKRILEKASEEEWILLFEHDPYTPAAKIEKTDKGYGIKEKVKF